MKNFVFALLTLTVLCAPISLQARQYTVRQGGREYVAHTRVAPVIVHRVLPPFRGQHIYQPPR